MNRRPVVEVENGREFRRALRRAEVDLAELKDAHQAAGQVVIAAAVPRAPRRTGKLAGGHRASRAQARARVTVAAVYAGPIHYGWTARNIAPQPWLLEAAVSSEPQWLPVYEADVERILRRCDREAAA